MLAVTEVDQATCLDVGLERRVLQPWEEHSYRLVSWFDVLQFSASAFFWCGRALRSIKGDCMVGAAVSLNNEAVLAMAQDLDDSARAKALSSLPSVEAQFRKIGMTITADTANELIEDLKGNSRHSFDWLCTQTDNIERLAEKELKGKLFFYISSDRAVFWPTETQPHLFDETVADTFPDANQDIAAAGRCLALNEGTACVFHLMRVLEHGLRPIATHFSVPFSLDSWHKVIKGIEDAIETLRNKRGLTEADRQDITFYSEAATQFRHFKDAWRNHVTHARTVYTPNEAESIFNHVKEFMQHQAARS